MISTKNPTTIFFDWQTTIPERGTCVKMPTFCHLLPTTRNGNTQHRASSKAQPQKQHQPKIKKSSQTNQPIWHTLWKKTPHGQPPKISTPPGFHSKRLRFTLNGSRTFKPTLKLLPVGHSTMAPCFGDTDNTTLGGFTPTEQMGEEHLEIDNWNFGSTNDFGPGATPAPTEIYLILFSRTLHIDARFPWRVWLQKHWAAAFWAHIFSLCDGHSPSLTKIAHH